MNTTRTCNKCGAIKSIALFEKGRSTCKACRNEYHRQKRLRNPHRTKAYSVKTNHGISLDTYNACMSSSAVCEICGSGVKLCYDHNHTTNEFRGVLCHWCNSGLGDLKDSIHLLLKAAKYLTDRGSYSSLAEDLLLHPMES